MPGINKNFIQEGPQLKNTFIADDLLRHFLRWRMPAEVFAELEAGLVNFGERCAGEVAAFGEDAEAHPPTHVPFDPWGRRIDRIETSAAWERLHRVAAEEGIVAIGYERAQGELSRLHQFAKLFLFHPSSAFYSCPLAMTDGAARVIELHGSPELKSEAFRNLTSRNPQRFWTSGQWMTERTGGSDVSGTSTTARLEDGVWRLYGDKWFTSATTSQMTMALAKVEGATDAREGLSLFYVELRDRSGNLQNIRINRLKDKLGTKALPTAELTLEGTPAVLVGEVGEGVKRVASLLNITRLYNATCSIGAISRALQLAKDYARRRTAFGRPLAEQPLHLQTLADMQSEYEGTFHLVFHLAHLLGKDETGKGTAEESALLRLLTPVAKLWSAKQAIALTSEALEAFGGAGYVEDTGLPRLLRDAQVFSIWEGTTNILSLDVLRALEKDKSLPILVRDLESRLSGVSAQELLPLVTKLKVDVASLSAAGSAIVSSDVEVAQVNARRLALSLARTTAACLMLEFAEWCLSRKQRLASEETVRRFCARPVVVAAMPEELDLQRIARTVFG